ncbi:hypothetical protein YC2023_040161 [Brassica napus]
MDFEFVIFCILRIVLGSSLKSSSSSLIVTTIVVHRVIELSHLYFCWCYAVELRRGGESDVGDAALHHHSTLESSQSTGDPHRYHMSRTKPPTPRSEQMRSPSTLACAPSVFFSTFSRSLIYINCLEPPTVVT